MTRIFTEREIEAARGQKFMFQHLAGRFAAKEAVFKACSGATTGRGMQWTEIEVVNEDGGRPVARLLTNRFGSHTKFIISISHAKSYAVANAIAFTSSEEFSPSQV